MIFREGNLLIEKFGHGYRVIKEIKSGCVNPKVEAGWHVWCPNCNKCGKFD